MRLINVSTLLLEEFNEGKIPQYAILSHTWEEKEVSFADMSDPSRNYERDGKIEKTCQIASQEGFGYVWVDTCCIDKSSSAELTESINSMYRWYQRADKCYAFLSDLPASSSFTTDLTKSCRWFSRGWTLQELIAPKDVHFFDQDWNYRGSKNTLAEVLSKITGIDTSILLHKRKLWSVAVAQRLSWAAYRETTRIEDRSYSLLGIFNVNMPMLYGEGEKAFRRLQEEIIKSTADFSIFAWIMPSSTENTKGANNRVFCGILAKEPEAFAMCGIFEKMLVYGRQEFSVSNMGVRTQVQVLSESIAGKTHATRYILPLACSLASQQSLGVRLRKCGQDQFIREDPSTLVVRAENLFVNPPRQRYLLTELQEMNLGLDSENLDMSLLIAQTRSAVLQIRLATGMEIYDAWPWGRFDDEDQLFFVSGDPRWDSGALRLRIHPTEQVRRRNRLRKTTADLEFDCMFFSVGWSMLETGSMQCTLLDYQSCAPGLNEVQSQITAWDHNRYQVLENLVDNKIPKCSSAALKIQGTQKSALISFTSTLVSDSGICPNSFWRIEFSCDICETDRLPQIRYDNWVL